MWTARLHLLAVMLVWGAWMFTTGLMLGTQTPAAAVMTIVLTVLAAAMLNPRVVELARRGNIWQVRAVALTGVLGLAGLFAGLIAAYPQSRAGELVGGPLVEALLFLRIGFGALGVVLLLLAPAGDGPSHRFFLLSRHAADAIARRSLVAAAAHALLVALAVELALRFPPEPDEPPFPRVLANVAIAYLIGAVLVLWQRYPQRCMGFLPYGGLLASFGLLAAWIAPSAEWPLLVIGLGLGLGHTPPRNDLLANVPVTQRTAAMLVQAAVVLLGAAVGAGIAWVMPSPEVARPVRLLITSLLTAAAFYWYLREWMELTVEPILAITNPIYGHGPGLKNIPTRGPVLVIANHAAWFDPLWLAKLIPLRLRPMMTARFHDLPLISWLMRRVFFAIRVPEQAYRRETPEIQEAIAALERGENVLIFPEGWLRRREDQPLKRFGQGIYQILREKPSVPVVVCWIEGNWGSFVSYFNGPPTKNKRPDLFRTIRIGISEPEVLSLELLHDHLATRRHLMRACLRARTFLGLPEPPGPPFLTSDEPDEKD